jgi:hypothetical protein
MDFYSFLLVRKNKWRTTMHAKGFLHKLLSSVMHLKRLATLSLLVEGALLSKKISVTNLGRSMKVNIQERSAIRRSDRFVGNKLFNSTKKVIYEQVIALLIGQKKQPKIIADWSPIPNTKLYVLRASLIARGRGLTLYEEVHTEKKQNNTMVQNKFLTTLSKLLPKTCCPIIVTDAGFHTPWFKQVKALGWDYVGRIRNAYKYSIDGGKTWKSCKGLHKTATETAQSFCQVFLSKESRLLTMLCWVKEKSKGRKMKTKLGKRRCSDRSKRYSKSAREPWVLCTSLEKKSRLCAHWIKKIYEQRMQIEEGFRDLKSSRYGLSFEEAFSRRILRVENLLLVAMLVALIAWLVGLAGERKGIHLQFQSNSLKTKRVLSLFFLGCQMIRRKIKISEKELFLPFTSNGLCYVK